MFSFCPFFSPFYSKMVWGTVIVCIIYTTGYKTPLCHSPESTYRCGCTVYKHMYCNKIILRAWLPHGRLLSPGLIEGTLRFWVQTKSLQISHWHNGHFVPLKQSFQESCSYRCITAAQSSRYLLPVYSEYFGWFLWHPWNFTLIFFFFRCCCCPKR